MDRSREQARLLLRKAAEEANFLARHARDAGIPAWLVGFHAQQAVEKALKAVLASRGGEFPRTHGLALLIDLVRELGIALPPDAAELPRLTPFGTTFRYEDESDRGAMIVLDRAWAVACVGRTVSWAQATVGPENNPGEGSV
jgi:HEPN domain-containing protein